jgi:hypothetical protein
MLWGKSKKGLANDAMSEFDLQIAKTGLMEYSMLVLSVVS